MSDPVTIYYQYGGNTSPFPPSFAGNPISYAFGLFGDVVAAAVALAILLAYVLEGRRQRYIDRQINNPLVRYGPERWSPLWFYLTGQKCFLAFVVMRCLPDALWMLAWGEVSRPTIELLLRVDMLGDGFAIIPLFMASLSWAWARQIIPQMLSEGARIAVKRRAPWDVVMRNGRIVLAVILIAFLVTVGKAGG